MFQSALVRRQRSGPNTVDAGVLAETLLFYNSVHIVVDRGLLHDLIVSIGADNLIDLLDEKLLTISYSRDGTGVMNNTVSLENSRRLLM